MCKTHCTENKKCYPRRPKQLSKGLFLTVTLYEHPFVGFGQYLETGLSLSLSFTLGGRIIFSVVRPIMHLTEQDSRMRREKRPEKHKLTFLLFNFVFYQKL